MDNLSKLKRSLCMSRIRSKNTIPERTVKGILRKLRIKAKYHTENLPGKPDIAIPKKKLVVFINGCFWHQHKNCKRAVMPKTNIKYWRSKLNRNINLQKKHVFTLKRLGWKVKVIWECQIKNKLRADRIVKRIIK